jgi:hypothetical protein
MSSESDADLSSRAMERAKGPRGSASTGAESLLAGGRAVGEG